MEMTYEQWCLMKKDLRRRFSVTGWTLLVYYGIMNVAVFFATFSEMVIGMMKDISSGSPADLMAGAEEAPSGAWGYLLAVAVGLIVLLCWKKPRYWKEELWQRGKPMTAGSFFSLLCLFMAGQLIYQIVAITVELILNGFGLSMAEGMEAMAGDMTSFSMFLYVGILAPISEEILFRGLIQRTLLPYGKRFAILCSAFCFGIFHGNLLQSPYAFLVGLVLGYVAAEYSISWAMVLHMFNNLMFADVLTRLTQNWPEEILGLFLFLVNLLFFAGGVIVLILRRREIKVYRHADPINKTCLRCYFSAPGVIVLIVLMGLSMVVTSIMMVNPI